MKKHGLHIILFLGIGLALSSCKTKKNIEGSLDKTSDISVADEKFQLSFFEGQKQKAIENYDKAYQKFQESAEFNPKEDAVFYELSKLDTLNSNFSNGLANIKTAVSLDPSNLWYSRLQADIEVELGDLNSAMSTLKSITDRDPEDILYRDKLASLASYQKDYKTALKAYNEIESEIGVNEDLTRQKYYVLMEQDNSEAALKELEKLVETFPYNISYYRNIAAHYQDIGQLDAALGVYEKIVALDPSDGNTQLALAEFYSAQGESEKSNQALKLGFADKNAPLEKKISILFAIIRSKDPKVDTKNLVEILQQTHPERGETWSISGDFAEMSDHPNDALTYYKKALALDPNYKNLWLRVSAMAVDTEDYNQLGTLSEKALTFFPLEAEFYLYQGISFHELGEYSKATGTLKTGLDFVLDNSLLTSRFQVALGKAYFKSKEYQLAQNWLEKAISNGVNTSGDVLEFMGDTYYQLGKTSEAMNYWKQARDLQGASDLIERKIADEKYIAE